MQDRQARQRNRTEKKKEKKRQKKEDRGWVVETRPDQRRERSKWVVGTTML